MAQIIHNVGSGENYGDGDKLRNAFIDVNLNTTEIYHELSLRATIDSPDFTGVVTLPSTTSIGPVTDLEIGYLDGVTSSIQTQLNLKSTIDSPTFTGTVTLPSSTSIGNVSNTELSYLDGVTSNLQSQLNSKANTTSPTFTGTVVLPSSTSIGSVSNTEISYLDGITSNVQTQINNLPDTSEVEDIVNEAIENISIQDIYDNNGNELHIIDGTDGYFKLNKDEFSCDIYDVDGNWSEIYVASGLVQLQNNNDDNARALIELSGDSLSLITNKDTDYTFVNMTSPTPGITSTLLFPSPEVSGTYHIALDENIVHRYGELNERITGHKTFEGGLSVNGNASDNKISVGESEIVFDYRPHDVWSSVKIEFNNDDEGDFIQTVQAKSGTIALLEDITGGGDFVTLNTNQTILNRKILYVTDNTALQIDQTEGNYGIYINDNAGGNDGIAISKSIGSGDSFSSYLGMNDGVAFISNSSNLATGKAFVAQRDGEETLIVTHDGNMLINASNGDRALEINQVNGGEGVKILSTDKGLDITSTDGDGLHVLGYYNGATISSTNATALVVNSLGTNKAAEFTSVYGAIDLWDGNIAFNASTPLGSVRLLDNGNFDFNSTGAGYHNFITLDDYSLGLVTEDDAEGTSARVDISKTGNIELATNGGIATYNGNELATLDDIISPDGFVTLDTEQTITAPKTINITGETALYLLSDNNNDTIQVSNNGTDEGTSLYSFSNSGTAAYLNSNSDIKPVLFIETGGGGDLIYAQSGAFSVTGAGGVTANTFTKTGGSSSEFLMADGSTSTMPTILPQLLVDPLPGAIEFSSQTVYISFTNETGRTGETFSIPRPTTNAGTIIYIMNDQVGEWVTFETDGTNADFQIRNPSGRSYEVSVQHSNPSCAVYISDGIKYRQISAYPYAT
ncbi:MAG: hypothetical protein V4572_12110 [Bacteroidota bacterium]